MSVRIVFMGSPEFSLPMLQHLVEHYNVVGVVTQPDRQAGRGKILTPPPVKETALSLNLPVIQPLKLKEPFVLEQLKLWQPDLIVVAAFGQIIRSSILNLPQFGCINVHTSLLPRWRGASPIQAALLNGDASTGVSIMKLDAGVDTGPFLSQSEIAISAEDTHGSLEKKLAEKGADLLIHTLPAYLDGRLPLQPQDERLATYAPMIAKEDGLLDFTQPAEMLVRKVRAYNPWPSAYIPWQNAFLKIHRAHVSALEISLEPGKRTSITGLPAISTAQGWLVLDEIQPAGKKAMAGKDFLNGVRSWSNI